MTKDREILDKLIGDPHFQELVWALRKTPLPETAIGVHVYRKSQLNLENVPLPFEKVVNHQNGDVSIVLKDMGAMRFINRVKREKGKLEKMRIIHDW